MARPIEYGGIKVGDRIRITREIEVSKLFGNEQLIRDVADGRTFFAGGATLELVSRPVPNLPTRVGSVVNVKSITGNASYRWMLHVSDCWNSQNGGIKTKVGFKQWLEETGFEFEVIA